MPILRKIAFLWIACSSGNIIKESIFHALDAKLFLYQELCEEVLGEKSNKSRNKFTEFYLQ